MLIKDGTPEIFSEQIEGAKEAITPVLPKQLQAAYDQAQAAKKVLDDQQKALLDVKKIIDNPVEAVSENLNKKVEEAATNSVEKAKAKATKKVDQAAPELNNLVEQEQQDLDEALKKEAGKLKSN
jgi:vacuolar-type H+-ATPase subunit E/Vma4